MKKIKYLILFPIAALLFCLPTSCGRTAGEDADNYIYVAESLPESIDDSVTNFSAAGDYVFFLQQKDDSNAVCRIPLSEIDSETDFSGSETVLALPDILSNLPETSPAYDSARILDYTLDSEQNLYCLAALYKGIMTPRHICGVIYKQSPEGSFSYCTALPELQAASWQGGLIAAGSEGRIFVLEGSSILMLDSNGEAGRTIPLEGDYTLDQNRKVRLLADSEGHVYYTEENALNYTRNTYLLDENENMQPTRLPTLSGRLSLGLHASPGGLLVQLNDDRLYRYDHKTDSLSEILKWGDSDLLESDIKDITQLTEDSFLLFSNPIDKKAFLLTKTPLSELPQKEQIVIASLFPDSALKQSVVDFNRSSTKYHVSIETFGADIFSEDENTAAYALLDASLLSEDTPDLLDLSSLDISKYAEGKMLEDLYSFISNDDLIDPENYLDNLLESYTVNGKLICIPKSFRFRPLWAVDSRSIALENWTLPEVIALTEMFPETPLLAQFHRDSEYMLETFCAPYCLEHFVDWEKGEASFDSDEFRHMLTWVKTQIGKTVNEGEKGLVADSEINQFINYLSTAWAYDAGAVMRGYPSADGEGHIFALTADALSILSGSGHKEGAWEFLRYFLSEDTYGNGFPTRKDLLAELAEEAVTPRYVLDENGNRIKDPEGKDWILPKGSIYIDGEPLEFFALEQEQADAVMDAIAKIDFSPRTGIEDTIIEIIGQEAKDFFDGRKTVEQVSAAIQNRIRTLLQESGLEK